MTVILDPEWLNRKYSRGRGYWAENQGEDEEEPTKKVINFESAILAARI